MSDELPPVSEEDFARAQKRRALRMAGIGFGLMVAGILATVILRSWLVNGGDIPALIGAGPLVAVCGAILGSWSLVDWIRSK